MTVILVEGSGDERSVPILLDKTKGHSVSVLCIDMQGKSNILRKSEGFEKTVLRQAEQGRTDFVVLLDHDVTFPPYKTLAQERKGVVSRAKSISRTNNISVKVFWAVREFESWLVGGLRQGDEFCALKRITKAVSGDTESYPEDPKKWIRQNKIDNRYSEAVQVCLAKHINWTLARKRNYSLRVFIDGM